MFRCGLRDTAVSVGTNGGHSSGGEVSTLEVWGPLGHRCPLAAWPRVFLLSSVSGFNFAGTLFLLLAPWGLHLLCVLRDSRFSHRVVSCVLRPQP